MPPVLILGFGVRVQRRGWNKAGKLMMDWEVINGVTGIISALCALGSIAYFGVHRVNLSSEEETKIISIRKLMSFLLACSGWVLCCLSFLWVAEPYGRYPMDYEYQQFFGVLLSFPAIVIFMFGFRLMQNESKHNNGN